MNITRNNASATVRDPFWTSQYTPRRVGALTKKATSNLFCAASALVVGIDRPFQFVGGGPGSGGLGGAGGGETKSNMLTAASTIFAPLLNKSLLNELVAIPSIDAAAAPFFVSPVTTVVMKPKTLVDAAKPSAALLASSVFPVIAPKICAVPVMALDSVEIVPKVAAVAVAAMAGPLSGVARARPAVTSAFSLATNKLAAPSIPITIRSVALL